MDYKETLQYLYTSTPVFEQVGASAYKEGLDNSLKLDEYLGYPHKKFKTIHVAGTNGKGSTAHMLAAILQTQGYKTGLYTSPHLMDFRERFKVNGKSPSEEYVIDFVRNHRHFFEPLKPSFFELTTAMAFAYFAQEQVDIAVIEVGLGGRLDCTNIITPILSVITNIDLDHTAFLGDTIEAIASEKAGIIKENIPVVIGEDNDKTRAVFEQIAKQKHSPLTFAQGSPLIKSYHLLPQGGIKCETQEWGDLHSELSGEYQIHNINTVLTAVKILQTNDLLISDTSVAYALGHVSEINGLSGRWQIIKAAPLTICDTGHNPAGWKYIVRQLRAFNQAKKHIIFGMVDDKDIHSVISLLPSEAIYYCVAPTTHRAIKVDDLHALLSERGLHVHKYKDITQAYIDVQSAATEEDLILISGSNYLVADFMNMYHGQKTMSF